MKQLCSILCGLIVVLSLAACTAIGSRATPAEVTLLGCVDSLTISLDGAEPQDYELNLTFPAGGEAGVRCVYGQAEESWVYGMRFRSNIQCFDGRNHAMYWDAPSNFTVTLTWDDNQIVQHYEPTYETFMGECHVGGITVTIPVSP
jgi:hypothetical protein